jgi:hypothetical protein
VSWAFRAFLILLSHVLALADVRATSQHLMPRLNSSATKSLPAEAWRSVSMLLPTIAGLSAREMADARVCLLKKSRPNQLERSSFTRDAKSSA